jgi:polar amino acid transport system substrate-binding protein
MLAISQSSAAELRLIYADHEVFPFFTGTGAETPPKPGMSIELSRQCATAVGATPVLARLPVRRQFEELRSGNFDALVGLSYAPDRAEYLVYPMRDGKPDPVRAAATISYVLYRPQGGSLRWDGKSISQAGGPLGVNSGFFLAADLRAKGIDVEEVPYDRQLFQMMERGRVAAVATLENIGDYYLSRTGAATKVEKLQPPMSTRDYYIPVTQRFYDANTALVENFWRCIAANRDTLYLSLAAKYLD